MVPGRTKSKKALYTVFGQDYIDPGALQQMEDASRLPVSLQGALMPDAHLGYGLPIGGVLATYRSVIPYGVGMDIGCRMCMSIYDIGTEILNDKSDMLMDIVNRHSRFGRAEFDDIREHEIIEREEFREIRFLKDLKDVAFRQLGTSGHGNHFVDLGIFTIDEDNRVQGLQTGNYFAILTHSGSRNMGAEIARHYTRIAQEKRGLTGSARDLAWLSLDEEEGQEYWSAMTLAGDYSSANHRIIHSRMSAALNSKPLAMIENHHNFAWKSSDNADVIIHRKGATPAEKGIQAIIPGSMTAPAYIVEGLGNEESLNSAAHGAGRLLSRRQAKKRFTRKQLDAELNSHGVRLIGGDIDEAPMAYKDIDRVMKYQGALVRTIGKFIPKLVRMA